MMDDLRLTSLDTTFKSQPLPQDYRVWTGLLMVLKWMSKKPSIYQLVKADNCQLTLLKMFTHTHWVNHLTRLGSVNEYIIYCKNVHSLTVVGNLCLCHQSHTCLALRRRTRADQLYHDDNFGLFSTTHEANI